LSIKKILIETQTKDSYGRTAGIVSLNDKNVNNELVKQSMAWEYKKYTDNETLCELENKAKSMINLMISSFYIYKFHRLFLLK